MEYAPDLMLRLARGAAALPEEVRARHTAYLVAAQYRDGGFAGRQGASDPYYTSFALRALAMLGTLDKPLAVRVAGFLTEQLERSLPSIDFLSLVTCAVLVEMACGADVFAALGRDRRQSMSEFIEPLRRDDGGYARTIRGGQGSTYYTFLAAMCQQMVGLPLGGGEAMVRLVRGRQRDDGGFVELAPLWQGGTNPTAAAVALLRMFDALDGTTRTAAAAFLKGVQTSEGGLRANTRIPLADLLSTFTGLVALTDLDALGMIDLPAARRFVGSLERPGGGFRGGAWDEEVDVEYTFYGLGALALLSAAEE